MTLLSFLVSHCHSARLQLQPRLALRDLLAVVQLGLGGRMVHLDHQLVDQRSQQPPDAGGHDGHPPPAASGPANKKFG